MFLLLPNSHLLIHLARQDIYNIKGDALIVYLLFSCAAQLKEFQQKSSPLNVGGEKGGGGGGAGAKKKRKVKGPSQHDVSSTDRSSPENVSCLPAFHLSFIGQTITSL